MVGGSRVVLTCACVRGNGFNLARGPGPGVASTQSTVIHIALNDVYADSLRVGRKDMPHTVPKAAIKRRVMNIIRRIKANIASIGPKSEMAIGIRAFYKGYFFYRRKCIGGYASLGNN